MGGRRLTDAAVCGDPLKRYDEGIFAQLICEQDRIVLVGESS
jgi:hypothetical protein